MSFNHGMITLFLLTGGLLRAAPQTQTNPRISNILRTHVLEYRTQGLDFVQTLARVSGDFRIPMGIEWIEAPSAQSPLTLSWRDTTVENVLETIVKTQPGYVMRLAPGAVLVSCPGLVDERENPLMVRIADFRLRRVPEGLAYRKLHEVTVQTISPPKPTHGAPGGVIGSYLGGTDEAEVSLELKDVTVQDILDAIAGVSTGYKLWVVTFALSGNQTHAGYRRTLGLGIVNPVPDDEQPVWDIFHWDDAIPSPQPARP